ncbi:IS66 family transposase zinc-finger binding domain-containing protein [Globicatella sanguinis]
MNRQNKCRTLPGEIETIQYTRKKSSGKRQLTLDQFPAEEKHYALEGEACHCPDCQHHLKEIGSHCYRQELVFIPAQIKRVDHIQHAYKCEHCSQLKDQDVIIKSTVPKAPLNHSLGSASIIAYKSQLKNPDLSHLRFPTFSWGKLVFNSIRRPCYINEIRMM